MAQALHTREKKQHICAEARRLLREGIKFSSICATFDMKPVTLRAWLNRQTREWIYPDVPNPGRL